MFSYVKRGYHLVWEESSPEITTISCRLLLGGGIPLNHPLKFSVRLNTFGRVMVIFECGITNFKWWIPPDSNTLRIVS